MIVAAVLAAGGSSRLGSPKQLVRYEGKPLILRALEVVSFLRCAVVLGARAAELEAVVHDGAIQHGAPPHTPRDHSAGPPGPLHPVTCLRNDAWASGMASSIHVATRWAEAEDAEALLLHLVDQPLVERSHLERLIAEYRAGAPLVGSSYAGVVGAPAIFARAVFPKLLALEGDRGAAPILRSHPAARAIAGPAGAVDVDTPEDVQRLAATAASKP